VTRLDLAGLELSAGSACASGSIEPSHVLLALGLARDEARSGLRISLGRNTTAEDCKRALAVFRREFSSSRAT
jgi:cysteine desulfurase